MKTSKWIIGVVAVLSIISFSATVAFATPPAVDNDKKNLKTVQDYMNAKLGASNVIEVLFVGQGIYQVRSRVNNSAINFTCTLTPNTLSPVAVTSAVKVDVNKNLLAIATSFTNQKFNITGARLQDWKVQGGDIVFTFITDNTGTTVLTSVSVSGCYADQTAKTSYTYNGGKLSSTNVETCAYDAQARVTSKKLETSTYGASNGKINKYTASITGYNTDGTTRKLTTITDTYGTNNKLAKHILNSKDYNADATVSNETAITDTYGANGKLSTDVASSRINAYNADKTLKNVWTENLTSAYHESGNLLSQKQENYYYEGVQLIAKRIEVDTYHIGNGRYEGASVNLATYSYYATGRMKEQNFITYYYSASNVLTSKTISNYQYDSLGRQTVGTTETINSNGGGDADEVLQRKAVESNVLATASNKLCSSQIVTGKPELPGTNTIGAQH
jgi:hypothetical protein